MGKINMTSSDQRRRSRAQTFGDRGLGHADQFSTLAHLPGRLDLAYHLHVLKSVAPTPSYGLLSVKVKL